MIENEQIQQLVDYFAETAEKELIRQYAEKGKHLARLFLSQFRIHFNNYGHMMVDDLALRHGINSLFVMAMDDVMCEVRASYSELRDTVISIYRAMLSDYFEEESKKLRETEDPWAAFVEWARKGNAANYQNDYFLLEEVDTEDGCFGFNINRCLYFEILREAGKPELGPILCEYDKILATTLESWIQFQRRETIATGDKRCDFRYCKK
jgi:hypothetical protein